MLALDSPRWRELEHLHGTGDRIPALLEQLAATAPEEIADSEAFDSLWCFLCDYGYGGIYTASYAATPHLVALAQRLPLSVQPALIWLAAQIEAYRYYDDEPAIPGDLEKDYFEALEQLRLLTLECLRERQEDQGLLQILLGTLAITNGFGKYGHAIAKLNPHGETCHECGATVPIRYYWPDGFVAHDPGEQHEASKEADQIQPSNEPDAKMPKHPLVENTIPILRVRDIHASLDYYLNTLGFTQEWFVDDADASMAGISRDGHSLYLSQAEQGQPGAWVWMGVQDARAFYAEYQASGAIIHQEPTNFPWALEFRVSDPDGNVLRIGSEPE